MDEIELGRQGEARFLVESKNLEWRLPFCLQNPRLFHSGRSSVLNASQSETGNIGEAAAGHAGKEAS
jgi:hypothetical protein